MEFETTTEGKLRVAGQWLKYMNGCVEIGTLNEEDKAEIDAVYNLIKEAIY